jgi:oxaloacetate decarboxylase gamma subunit
VLDRTVFRFAINNNKHMETDFSSALTLLFVGMISVFSILLLVVFFGQLLIRTVNHFFPEGPTPAVTKHLPVADVSLLAPDKNRLAAIVAAVDIYTHGKGRITSIKKND